MVDSRRRVGLIKAGEPPPVLTPEPEVIANAGNVKHAWAALLRNLDSDDAHQHFMGACIAASRLPFALASYRRLQQLRPNDPLIERALKQLGTLLAVSGMGPPRERSGTRRSKLLRALIALIVALIAAAGLFGMAQALVRTLSTPG